MNTKQTASDPEELLKDLRDVFDLESREISIDYFLLYRTSLGLYQAFTDKPGDKKLAEVSRLQLTKDFCKISFSEYVETVLMALDVTRHGSDKKTMTDAGVLVSHAAEFLNGIAGADVGGLSASYWMMSVVATKENSPGVLYDG